MADRRVKEIVQDASSGEWSIPEFQREFEWKYEQVVKLCDSLCEDLPIGLLTVWKTSKYNEPQVRPVSGRVPLWVVDGQQRVTSLCILTGRKPNWMNNDDWEDAFKKRVFINIGQDGTAVLGRLNKKAEVAIPLDEILNRNPGEASRFVQEKCAERRVASSEAACDLAVSAFRILERVIPVAEVGEDKEVEEIAELYRRLNQQGTRLRQAQIMLAYVAQYNRGWVREHFKPFLDKLNTRDEWELDPAHVLQVATILAEGKARVGKARVPDMWQTSVLQLWPKLRGAIDSSILYLWDRGITEQGMVPSSYTFIMLFAIQAKYMDTPGYDLNRAFNWFVLANLQGRYGDAPLETLTRDGRDVFDSSDFHNLMIRLTEGWGRENLRKTVKETFRDNSSQALLLHVLLWSSQAKDLVQGLSIPALTQASSQNLEPHWHHIVPKSWGKDNGFRDCDKTANVTRICGKTNITSALKYKPPWQYVPELNITKEVLLQHLIPEKYADKFIQGEALSPRDFKDFIKEREELIAQQAIPLLGL